MSSPRPSEPLQRLRVAVEQADHVAGAAAYHEAQSLFTACLSSPQYLRDLQQLAPEYGKPEFLLCVDSAGSPVYPTGNIVEDFRKTVTEHPSFGLWFQEATVEEDGRLRKTGDMHCSWLVGYATWSDFGIVLFTCSLITLLGTTTRLFRFVALTSLSPQGALTYRSQAT